MRDLRFTMLDLRAVGTMVVAVLITMLVGCAQENVVVVYTSQDQVYSEPILKQFTRETGIEVKAVYDSEAVKTVGLVNRLIAEKNNPQCDVFWNNEELRTRQLASQNLFRETNGWAAFGYRSRRIAVTNASANVSFVGLTNELYRGKVVMAYPLFGTTATHFLALRQHWGAEQWQQWCRALVANKTMLVDGNSVVVKLVAKGEAAIGLTDSDDIAAMQREGAKLVAGEPYPEMLLIPNTVAVLRNAPHPDGAQRLFEYLQSKPVAEQLVAVNALEGVSLQGASTLQVNWDQLLGDLDAATAELKEIFLR